MKIDLTKVHLPLLVIGSELDTLGSHYVLLKSAFKSMQAEAFERAWIDDLGPDDSISLQLAYLAENVHVPRLVWGSFVVMTWAVFEAALIDIAEFLRARKKIESRMDELSGGLFERIKRYYRKVLDFELADLNGRVWQQIEHTGNVRHAFAHTAGRVAGIKGADDLTQFKKPLSKQRRSGIKKAIEANIGVSVDGAFGDYYLVVNEEFATASFEAVDTILRDLLKRAGEEANRLMAATS